MVTTGGCLCGAVRWAYDGGPRWVCHCHCESCRRQCAAPVVTFVGVGIAAFRWTGAEPRVYHSSPGVTRHFCGTCGSPIAFSATRYPDEIHLYAAGHDAPLSLEPQFHVFHREALPWLPIADHLPRHPGSADGAG